jgi:hypothetical protein
VTHVTDRGGGNGGGWGEIQDEFKRRVMGKKDVLVGLLCAACFIPIGYQHFFINQEIQSRTPQEKQASVPIAKANIRVIQ